MLSEDTIQEINDQIELLVREYTTTISDRRREAALAKIKELRSLLNPSPAPEIDYDELADAIVRKLTPKPREPETLGDLIHSLFGGTR